MDEQYYIGVDMARPDSRDISVAMLIRVNSSNLAVIEGQMNQVSNSRKDLEHFEERVEELRVKYNAKILR